MPEGALGPKGIFRTRWGKEKREVNYNWERVTDWMYRNRYGTST